MLVKKNYQGYTTRRNHTGLSGISIKTYKKREIITKKHLEAGLPVFREAVSAINWPSLSWLERYFAFLSTV